MHLFYWLHFLVNMLCIATAVVHVSQKKLSDVGQTPGSVCSGHVSEPHLQFYVSVSAN